MSDIYEHIAAHYSSMSKTQRKIADYIIANKSSVSFLNVSKLAKLSGVSEASIIRFSTFLGFSGWPELQQHLQVSTQMQLSMKERLTMSYEVYDNKDSGISEVFKDDINNIQETLNNINMDTFYSTVNALAKADKIVIACGRSANALGIFLQYYLNIICGNATLINSINGEECVLQSLKKKDVFIGITFSKYTKSTVALMEYANKKDCITVSITDNVMSPIVPYSRYSFYTETKMPTFLDSFTAPLTLINALITYLGRVENKNIENRMSQLDDMWTNLDIFE